MDFTDGIMEINVNHILCTSWSELEQAALPEVVAFLREWYDGSPYIVAHTSGSTGIPKELKLLKCDMKASAKLTNDYFGIDRTSVLLLCLSPDYIAGKMMIVRALCSGACLLTVSPSSHPLDKIEEKIDFAAMVPMQVQKILENESGKSRLNRIKKLIIGGAPVSQELESKLKNLSVTSYITYGMTETVSHVALRQLNDGSNIYFALGDISFSEDNRNCLVIHAPHLSQKVFVTNDVVSLCDRTHFIWRGRFDWVINSGGVKIFPESIEKKLASVIPVRFFVTGVDDVLLGQKVVLVLEGEMWDEKEEQKLRACMNNILGRYEQPREIKYMPVFRETASGKIIREIN